MSVSANWSTDAESPSHIKIFKYGILVGSVVHKDDSGGSGWKYLPNTAAWRPSRRYWLDPISAVKGRLPDGAADVVAKRFAQIATPSA